MIDQTFKDKIAELVKMQKAKKEYTDPLLEFLKRSEFTRQSRSERDEAEPPRR